jgi:tellurite resistance protein TerC
MEGRYVMIAPSLWAWVGFTFFVLGMLALDLGVFNRKTHTVSIKEALIWSLVWITLALVFNVGLFFFVGSEAALQFFTGYLIEKSLSVDNIFIFVLIFSYFSVPARYQHRVLFWGVFSALILRGMMIGLGSVLIEEFHWILYIFGAFLIFTGIRMGVQQNERVEPNNNPVVKLVRRMMPVTEQYEGGKFVVRRDGRSILTPLMLVLIVIETMDIVFAVDSIPAIFAVTTDPFIVFTSNVFAILGLRSLYFVFANIIDKFYYLKIALAVILTFIGMKMLLTDLFHIPTWSSLLVIAVVLTIAIVASIVRARRLKDVQVRVPEEVK